jgi:arylsulfatase
MLMNLRSDPFERAWNESIGYEKWALERVFMIAPVGNIVAEWLQSFKDFPPRQTSGSFNLSNVLDSITKGVGDK